jgi:hypothetical protein
MFILLSLFVLLPIYLGCLNEWTVLDPQSQKVRFQIGFGTEDWSLLQKGLDLKAELGVRGANPSAMMMHGQAFREGGPSTIWKPWTINLASAVLVALYFSTLMAWAAGFTFVTRHKELH